MADTLVYDLASMTEGSPSVFVKKDWLSILDNQNGNYRGNQSVIDTSQLSNSNKYMNYREAYLAVPMVLTASGVPVDAPATAATSMDYAYGLKNWYGSIIHSMTLDFNGTTIVQQTPFCGLWNVFKLMTSLSWADVATMGSSIGFYPDSALSFSFATAASTDGLGTCNTNNAGGVTPVTGILNSYDSFNKGFLKRQQYINYDADGLTASGLSAYSALLTRTNASQFYKSQIYSKVDASDIIQIQIMAIIYLKHIHSFFSNVPLLKGVFMKMTLNLNQTTVSDVCSAATSPTHTPTITSPLGGVSPILIASSRIGVASTATVLGVQPCGGSGNYAVAGGTQIVTLSVGNTAFNAPTGSVASGLTNSIQLYVPAYTFNPVYEQAYLSSPVKRIVYTDIYQYQVLSVGAGASFNNLITNGIAGIKSVLVLPFFTTAANSAVPPLTSPFDTAGGGTTSPLVALTNFNVVVSGQNMLYNTQKYGYEQWLHNTYGANAVNGGLTDGITSSLINQLDWETLYSYYYVNCSRMLPVEESVPKSVSLIGTNLSALAIDLYVFIEYQVEVSVDVLTGARV
jgi:hypothetical protein